VGEALMVWSLKVVFESVREIVRTVCLQHVSAAWPNVCSCSRC